MKLRFILALIGLAALSRLLPHPPNFAPITAMGLLGAAYFPKKWMAFAVPFTALFVSDLILNNVFLSQYFEGFVWVTSPILYLSFAAVIGLGFLLLNKVNPLRVATASLISSIVFFLISNLSTWLESGMYPRTGTGLMACYTAGLPFLAPTMLGDLVFSAILFGAVFAMGKIPSFAKAI